MSAHTPARAERSGRAAAKSKRASRVKFCLVRRHFDFGLRPTLSANGSFAGVESDDNQWSGA
jgi:hypothetical protein